MKEISDIIRAYNQAVKVGKKSALATVVKVVGSSYRRPGARMLITEDGNLTGAISGGCLEGDALRKALSAIMQGENKLVTYDTTDEDDAKFGVQLGCNGIVHILFEPLEEKKESNPILFLIAVKEKREPAVLVTLFSIEDKIQEGTCGFYKPGNNSVNVPHGLQIELNRDLDIVFEKMNSAITSYKHCEQNFNALLEYLPPVISLVIAGAGNDAQPLAEIANLIGWETTIVDGRPAYATHQRFPVANHILLRKPENILLGLEIDRYTAFVLMTHNYNYDLALLKALLKTNAAYIGTLGPKKKLIRMLEELGLLTEENLARIYGPIGLDIGAETAEDIAVSIIAEVKAVFSGASAKFLKDKQSPIHVHELGAHE
ncbi:MAG: XdhC family protein [Bacteroidota bacterium]